MLRDPLRNRGAAFDDDQRGQLGLTGRLPSAVEILDGPAAYLSINRLVDIKPPGNRWSWPDDIDPERPIIINNVMHCAAFLGDACDKLCEYSVEDTNLDRDQIDRFVGASLILVTASPRRVRPHRRAGGLGCRPPPRPRRQLQSMDTNPVERPKRPRTNHDERSH